MINCDVWVFFFWKNTKVKERERKADYCKTYTNMLQMFFFFLNSLHSIKLSTVTYSYQKKRKKIDARHSLLVSLFALTWESETMKKVFVECY